MKWFLDLSTKAKLALGLGMIILPMALVLAFAYQGLRSIRDLQDRIFEHDYRKLILLSEIRGDLNRQRSHVLELVRTEDPAERSRLEASVVRTGEDVASEMEKLSGLIADDPDLAVQLQEWRRLTREIFAQRLETIELVRKGRMDEARHLPFGEQSERVEKLREMTRVFTVKIEKDVQSAVAASQKATERHLLLFSVAGVLAALLSVLVVLFLNGVIARPLDDITAKAGRIAEGDLGVDVAATDRRDEVGRLQQAFHRMLQSLGETARAAKDIAAGKLRGTVKPQSDRDVLANAFAAMAANLRRMMGDISGGVNVLATSASEILAATAQVAAGAAETATAISETSTTVEEVKQTTHLTTKKAKAVSENAQKAAQVAQNGRKTVEQSLEAMVRIRDQMESVAESTVRLSEQSLSIGEIIESVNDLTEQSNILAVNAAIEAAKAGEAGRGFAVVAQEIRSLAEQSKQATSQVRAILGEIQKGIGSAVLATEQVGKAVEGGLKQSEEMGQAFRQLVDTVTEAADSAIQIAASSQQQLVGMDQVGTAMDSIRQASAQNLGGTKQTESAAQSLHQLGQKLKEMVDAYEV